LAGEPSCHARRHPTRELGSDRIRGWRGAGGPDRRPYPPGPRG